MNTTAPTSPFGSIPPYQHPEGTRLTPNRPTVEQSTWFEVQFLDPDRKAWAAVGQDIAEAAYSLYADCLRAQPDRQWRIVQVTETHTVHAEEVGLLGWFTAVGGNRPSVDIGDLAAMLHLTPTDSNLLWQPPRADTGETRTLRPGDLVHVRAGRVEKDAVTEYVRLYQAHQSPLPVQPVTDTFGADDTLAYLGRLHVLVAARLLGRPMPVAIHR